MHDRTEYFALIESRPELFRNPFKAAFTILLEESEIRQAESTMVRRLEEAGAPPEWARVGIAFRDQYVLLLRDAVRYADGSVGTYIRMVNPNPEVTGVVTLPVWNGKILLIKHFRHATRTSHVEIPRGFGAAADSEDNARQELSEEIEATVRDIVSLGWFYPDTGLADFRVHLYYVEVESYGKPESIEGITEILPTEVSEVEQMIRDGEISDSYTLVAFARAKATSLI